MMEQQPNNNPFSVNLGKNASSGLKKEHPSKSEITVKQFLDFLKTAYQVQDNLEGILMAKGMMDVVDWIKIKDGQGLKSKSTETLMLPPATTSTSEGDNVNEILEEVNEVDETLVEEQLVMNQQQPSGVSSAEMLREKSKSQVEVIQEKLSEMISEGIIDTVLPLLMPSASTTVTTQRRASVHGKLYSRTTSSLDVSGGAAACATTIAKRRSSAASVKIVKHDSEVEIHVSDEIKGAKRDFICNQRLLIEQMGYFADVTKDQRLEDMDISVHCDITIFEWLMNWVKRESANSSPNNSTDSSTQGGLVTSPHSTHPVPRLECSNVVPILVSASFLQMEPLIQECLLFCHEHMNDILKTASSMSCLNDSVLTRLSAMYTNVEVENLRDRKDKIQSRLFCKLIQSMCEPDPETLRGHYATLATLYRCKYCHQLIQSPFGNDIPCVPSMMSLQFDGSVKNMHARDPQWDLNEFIVSMQKSVKTWRKVYWRLWGCTHFLYCLVCRRYFPVKQHGWCRYHPDHPQYFTLDAQRPPLPVGRYPCCGERAYRFQLLDDRSGCYFREHTPSTKDIKEAAIAAMLDNYRHLISEEAPKLIFPDRLTRLIAREPTDPDDSKLETKELFWWEGLEIVPPRPRLGLLEFIDERRGYYGCGTYDDDRLSGMEAGDSPLSDDGGAASSDDSSLTSSSSVGSEEESMPRKTAPPSKKPQRNATNSVTTPSTAQPSAPSSNRRRKKITPRLWQHSLSARSNQDLQRNHEEVMFKQMALVLNARTAAASACAANTSGGGMNASGSGGIQSGGAQSEQQTTTGGAGGNKSASVALSSKFNAGGGGGGKHGTPQGGVWVRLESEWKEKNAPMNKTKNIYTGKVRMRTSRLV